MQAPNNKSKPNRKRLEKVIQRIFEECIDGFKGGLSADNYISIIPTSKATATRDLQDLVEIKALTKTGILKGTRYYINLEESDEIYHLI